MRFCWVIIGWLLFVQSWTFSNDLFLYIHAETNRVPENIDAYSCDEIIAKVREREWSKQSDTVGSLNQGLHIFDEGRLQSEFYYYIPKGYDGTKPMPVLIYLHGRVSHALPGRGRVAFSRWKQWCETNGYILILPSGQRGFPWWSELGEDHVFETLRHVSSRYHIDHKRVFLSGVSDGASSTYLMGMRYTDRFAAGVAWLGSLQVNRELHLGNSPFFVGNFKAMPWWIVTGGRDKVYPLRGQKSIINHLQVSGVDLVWKHYKKLAHSESGAFDLDSDHLAKWLKPIKRGTVPVKLDWSVNNPDRYGQHHWLQVHKLKDDVETPISEQWVLPRLNKTEKVQNDLGIHFMEGEGAGLRVSWCEPGSVGEAIGLHPYDMIVRINEIELVSVQSWLGYWQSNPGGELTVRRNNLILHLPIKKRPVVTSREKAVVGRILAQRDGNRIKVKSQNIAAFDILVSPDLFDLSKEIVVCVNEREYFRGRVNPTKEFLLAQLRKRNGDPTVVYVGYIPIVFDPVPVQ